MTRWRKVLPHSVLHDYKFTYSNMLITFIHVNESNLAHSLYSKLLNLNSDLPVERAMVVTEMMSILY